MGITNVSTHPGAARLVGEWIPPRQQNFVNGLVNFAALMGISLTYPLFGKMIDRFGWTDASFIAAGGTLCLALLWGLLRRQSDRTLDQIVRKKAHPRSVRCLTAALCA